MDLTGKLPPGTRRIRLMTNLQIYWDQVLIDQSEGAQTRTTEVPLVSAALDFRGYPKQIEGTSPGDLNYDYNLVSLSGPFQRERGDYTHFGDVTPLLRSVDNKFVVFGSGEEIAAEFDAGKLPALPAHWKRDYFLLCQRVCEGYGLVGCVAFHRCANAIPWHEYLSIFCERKISRRCRLARLPVELERQV